MVVEMKTRLLTVICVLAITFGGIAPSVASSESGPLEVIADVMVVRPGCFLATVIGSAVFVVCLPVAAISKSVDKTADVLVVKPAKATFSRPVGDLEGLED
jgi:hypothetical protein